MDAQDAKQIVEAAQAAFELKIVERVRKTEEDLANWVRTVESKLQSMQQIAWAIAAVAVIFGISGAWGWKLLLDAKTELDTTGRRVTQLSTSVNNLEPIARLHVELLQKTGTEQLDKFHEGANREADAAYTRLRGEISSISLSHELQTRTLKIVNATGRTLISLGAGPSGGRVEVFSTTSGEQISSIGSLSDGNGGLSLSDKSGRELLRGIASDKGGVLQSYNLETGKAVASLGVSNDGNGIFSLSEKSGRPALRGIASDKGGVLQSYNLETGKAVASLGASNDGHGIFLLSDKSGPPALRENRVR